MARWLHWPTQLREFQNEYDSYKRIDAANNKQDHLVTSAESSSNFSVNLRSSKSKSRGQQSTWFILHLLHAQLIKLTIEFLFKPWCHYFEEFSTAGKEATSKYEKSNNHLRNMLLNVCNKQLMSKTFCWPLASTRFRSERQMSSFCTVPYAKLRHEVEKVINARGTVNCWPECYLRIPKRMKKVKKEMILKKFFEKRKKLKFERRGKTETKTKQERTPVRETKNIS